MRKRAILIVMVCMVNFSPAEPFFNPGKAAFSVKYMELTSDYRISAMFVLPKEKVDIEIEKYSQNTPFEINCMGGEAVQLDLNRWQWTAPGQTGLTQLTVRQSDLGDSIQLNVFVMVPYDSLRGEYLNGYRMGKYPDIPLKQLKIYKKPRGFIEVTADNIDTPISPHFRLGQFLCKQEGDYPKYLVLRMRLVLKLERILEEVNKKGNPCQSFEVMSGYRTPYYNKAIGNVKYSRHLWGGAADIYIDENPKDGDMDDLNKDKVINYKDAAILYDIVDKMYGQAWYETFVGGLGRYRRTKSHGPFVHVDVRGFRARWGD
jgi:hypothetical protein